MKKKLIYIATSFIVLAVIGAFVENKRINTPAELVGSYELKNRTTKLTTIEKLTFEATGSFQSELHLISHDPLLVNVPDGDPIKGFIKKIENDGKITHIFGKVVSVPKGMERWIGKTFEFQYETVQYGKSITRVTYFEEAYDRSHRKPKLYMRIGAPHAIQRQTTKLSQSSKNIVGKYTLQGSPGEMTIDAGVGGIYGVSIVSTTPSGCVAEIEHAIGTVKSSGELWATKLTSDGKTQCVIDVRFDQQRAIVSELGCTDFHGISCSFSGIYIKK